MSAIRIQFKLAGLDKERALALQKHVRTNMGMEMELNQIVHNQFINWMRTQIISEVIDDGSVQADTNGDSTVTPATIPGSELGEATQDSNSPQ